MMIGLPLALGSLYLRAIAVSRGRLPPASTKGRYLLGSLRYLVGGGMSRRRKWLVLVMTPACPLVAPQAAAATRTPAR